MTPSVNEARTVYEQIAADLREQIRAGTLRPGQRLESVRDLAERYDASPGTAKQALHLLKTMGLVYSESTRGYFVSEEPPAEADEPETFGPGIDAVLRELREIRGEMRGLGERLRRVEEALGTR